MDHTDYHFACSICILNSYRLNTAKKNRLTIDDIAVLTAAEEKILMEEKRLVEEARIENMRRRRRDSRRRSRDTQMKWNTVAKRWCISAFK